jgi:uncharacterized protein YlbG (UPF0298 family)
MVYVKYVNHKQNYVLIYCVIIDIAWSVGKNI